MWCQNGTTGNNVVLGSQFQVDSTRRNGYESAGCIEKLCKEYEFRNSIANTNTDQLAISVCFYWKWLRMTCAFSILHPTFVFSFIAITHRLIVKSRCDSHRHYRFSRS
ncbi:uncharacterized protein L3040_003904 [Drepanopeziza brunnea f. sp. 'multigermtubi']|uniref:uncharacterized protein n=1 Tax=Drepanopeziza brunnea f. sp. 'multigermtubi' TaxID=698441 RepID=UPI00239B69A8|nr:hypothetical protein L3040_003904 [Drepanopeziza brunnea f. sp. 'multigermtubi']